jgi:glycosyltransferase involved in cell wall biosynthesis
MRIAICSNLFPPLWLGGYETGAAEVVRELQRRGHEVLVLTAARAWTWNAGRFERLHQPEASARDKTALVDAGPCILGPLTRLAPWRVPGLLLAALRARSRYRAALTAFAPDLVFLFNPLGLLAPVPSDLVRWGREHQVPVRFYVSDPWLVEWPLAHPLLRLIQRCPWVGRGLGLLRPPKPDQLLFCSRYLRDACTEDETAPVIPWGVANLNHFDPLPARHFQARQPLTLVYAGQVQPHKGLDLLLQALTGCRKPHGLKIVGDDRTAHAADCRQLARRLGLDRQVEWLGPCSPGELPRQLPQLGQVLIVPSRWQEPFSRVVLEGLAAGLPVVASRTGGTPEALAHGQTGFLFNPDQPRELTSLLDRLEAERRLAWQVGQNGQYQARHQFSIERMVDRLLADPRRKEVSRARRVQSLAGSR